MKFIDDIFSFFKGITVFALVGESGTGKSFRAKLLAQKYDINAIIDDGLLIQDDKILAGHSAKREKTFLAAVRTAVFDDKEHRDEIARALKKEDIRRLLILGTSEKMVLKIAMRLQVPPPSKIIKIEDIATKEEIELAIRSRHIEGKHVIPVPSLQIKRSYPQIFYDSIRIKLARKEKPSGTNTKVYEKSVVRPEFSKKGRVSISEAALTQMVMHCVSEFDPEIKIKKLAIKTNAQGYKLVITTDVPFGTELAGKIHNLQKYVIQNIERYTGILIESVNIIVDKISR
ncbi:hypothetical protein H0R92_00615 [Treponema sp. OMZ 840]|uniref:hypothetical protein n=1 Tax=Treponema sp. OMZ 840 TaxID=244313 RepID=UPI003D929622